MWEFIKPILTEFQNPVIYAIPFFLLLILIEAYINYKERTENYLFIDSVASISMGIVSAFIDVITKATAFFVFSWLYLNVGLFSEALSFTLLGWVLLFFLDDFCFYWHHRMSHQVRVLWAAHVNHHSSTYYNLSTALRQSWSELIYKYIFYLILPIIGFHPIMILTQISISLIYQFCMHTKRIDRLPRIIELLFNTPSHHRVHHASNIMYLDRNHAGILIIWDRMFGTFQEEDPAEPVIYGITTDIKTYNPLRIASHEFVSIGKDLKRASTLRDKLGYLFMPPGWSHDGNDQRSDTLRAAMQQKASKE